MTDEVLNAIAELYEDVSSEGFKYLEKRVGTYRIIVYRVYPYLIRVDIIDSSKKKIKFIKKGEK
ncbi:MAG: hypothetical protein ACUVUQ_11370 [Thermodesulfovibrionales bacterium]